MLQDKKDFITLSNYGTIASVRYHLYMSMTERKSIIFTTQV